MIRIKNLCTKHFKRIKLAIAALDLAQEIWQLSNFGLTNDELRHDVHKLAALFQKSADFIAQENSHLIFRSYFTKRPLFYINSTSVLLTVGENLGYFNSNKENARA